MDVVIQPRQRGGFARFLGGLPVVLGSALLLVVRMGPSAALLVVGVTVLGLVAALRILTHWSARTYQSTAQVLPGILLRAEAGINRTAGIVTLERSRMLWVPRKSNSGSPTVELCTSEITSVELTPVTSILLKAARLTIHPQGGGIQRMTVTAAPEAVEHALRQMT